MAGVRFPAWEFTIFFFSSSISSSFFFAFPFFLFPFYIPFFFFLAFNPSYCIFFLLLTDLVIGRRDRTIYKTVEEALIYLDARTEFWRQQKPMYARKREKELNRYKPSPTRPVIMGYPCNFMYYIIAQLSYNGAPKLFVRS